MSVIQRETSIGANATDPNILSGSAFEILRQNSVVSMGVVGNVTGLVATIQAGSDVILEESPLTVKTIMPVIPDDFAYQDVAAQLDRLVIRVRNTTGGAITVRAIVQVQAV